MTEAQLALHDGSRPTEYPLYMAIDGDVYDISDGGMRNYGPGGPYHVFAGRDAARGALSARLCVGVLRVRDTDAL